MTLDFAVNGYYIIHPDDRESDVHFTAAAEEAPLETLQTLVGGPIQLVPAWPTPSTQAICNEEGKLRALPYNNLANKLWGLPRGDYLCGTVVVLCGTARRALPYNNLAKWSRARRAEGRRLMAKDKFMEQLEGMYARALELVVETGDVGEEQHKLLAFALLACHIKRHKDAAIALGRKEGTPEATLARVNAPSLVSLLCEINQEIAINDIKHAALILPLLEGRFGPKGPK